MLKRVLVIDDDEAIRKVFLLALEDSEFQTDTALSGKAGLALIQEMDYHLVFLDLKMPEMDGVETLKKIRAIDKDLPVYIITAFSGEYFHQLADIRKDGIDFELVRKPIGTVQIRQVVRGVTTGTGVLNSEY